MTRQELSYEVLRSASRHQQKPTYWRVIVWNYWLRKYLKAVKGCKK